MLRPQPNQTEPTNSSTGLRLGVHGPTVMPVRVPLAQDHAFTPEDVKVLIDAFEGTLRPLKLAHREDPLTTTIAKSIIELAKQGERDPTHLRDFALKIVTAKNS